METNRAGDLDPGDRWRVVTGKKARAQSAFVKWRIGFAMDNPANLQTASPSDAARMRT